MTSKNLFCADLLKSLNNIPKSPLVIILLVALAAVSGCTQPLDLSIQRNRIFLLGRLLVGQTCDIRLIWRKAPDDQQPVSVTADLSQIGGEAAQVLVADDNNTGLWRWSGQVTPAAAGEQLITITTADSQGRKNSIRKRFRVFDTTKAVAIAQSTYGIGIALKADGTVRAWGCEYSPNCGQCTIPADLSDVVAVSASPSICMALKQDGTITVWGSYQYAQMYVPAGLTDVVSIYAGPLHCLALKADGTVVVWGDTRDIPADLTDVIAVAGSCGIKADGSVVYWGKSGEPVPENLRDAVSISAGVGEFYMGDPIFIYAAVKADGDAAAWGEQMRVPLRAGGGFTAITLQGWTTLGLRKDGSLVGWWPSGVPFGTYFPYYALRGMEHIVAVDGSLALDKDGRVFHVDFSGHDLIGHQPLPDEL